MRCDGPLEVLDTPRRSAPDATLERCTRCRAAHWIRRPSGHASTSTQPAERTIIWEVAAGQTGVRRGDRPSLQGTAGAMAGREQEIEQTPLVLASRRQPKGGAEATVVLTRSARGSWFVLWNGPAPSPLVVDGYACDGAALTGRHVLRVGANEWVFLALRG